MTTADPMMLHMVRALLTEGLSLFPSFPLGEGAVFYNLSPTPFKILIDPSWVSNLHAKFCVFLVIAFLMQAK